MKKRIIILGVILFSIIGVNVKAMSITPTASKVEVLAGTEFDVYITVERTASEKKVSAIEGKLSFDTNLVSLKSSEVVLSNWIELSGVSLNGTFSYGNLSFNNLISNTNVNVVKVTFLALENKEGQTTISISNTSGTDEDANILNISGGSLNLSIYMKSKNNNLDSITIDGKAIENFNSETINYTKLLPYTSSSVTIGAVKSDSKASVSGDGVKNLNVGNNTVNIVVTSEAGTTKTYTLVLTREDASATELSGITIDGTNVSNFSSSTTNYSKSVVNSKSSMVIGATAKNSSSNVSGTGTKSLNVGNNIVNIVVTSPAGATKTYTLTITREDITAADLNGITIDGTIVSNFSSSTTSYSKTIMNTKSSVAIGATAKNNSATISGTGTKSLNVGNNIVNIVVTSLAGTSKTYTLTITREDASATELSGITIDGTNVSNFSSSTTSYSKNVMNSKSSLVIGATAKNSSSTISGTGNKNLNIGNNVFDIVVTSSAGGSKRYTLTITRESNTALQLSDLKVDGESFSNFNSSLLTYNKTVPNNKSSVKIEATPQDSSSTISGTGVKNLNVGKNKFDIIIVSNVGASRTYTINITREDKKTKTNTNNETQKTEETQKDENGKSTINTLSEVKITNVEELKFESDKTIYNVEVENDIKEIEIESKLTDSKSKYVEGYGNRKIELKEGNNKIEIRVEAETGKIKTYTFNVTRKTKQYVKDIKVVNHEFDFSYTTKSYNIAIKEEDTLEIQIEMIDERYTYEIIGNDNLDNNSIIRIKAKDENGIEVEEYQLKIKKIGSNTVEEREEKEESPNIIIPIIVIGVGIISLISVIVYKKKKSSN